MILKDKVAIITGGARGIGRAIAILFAGEGAKVVITSRTLSELKNTAEQIRSKNSNIVLVRADISKQKDVDNLIKQAIRNFNKIDILVNNAGTVGPIGPAAEINIKDWISTINVNLIGTFLCIKAVLPHMIKQGGGKIINLSGGGAVFPRPYFSAYSASKAAVIRLTETLAKELKKYNIQINAVAPGSVRTNMTEEIIKAGKRAGKKEIEDARRCLKTGGISPFKAAELALFLVSSDSDGITGKLISAEWDDWRNFARKINKIMNSSLYSMRRIDGRYFKEAKQC